MVSAAIPREFVMTTGLPYHFGIEHAVDACRRTVDPPQTTGGGELIAIHVTRKCDVGAGDHRQPFAIVLRVEELMLGKSRGQSLAMLRRNVPHCERTVDEHEDRHAR